MCGIAGFMGAGDEDVLRAMAKTLAHRGPDGTGVWFDIKNVTGLAHTRLAVIDLSQNARQPMTDASGRYTIVFNGEIYNFAELKKELSGYPFKTQGDTEVILAAYAAWGSKAFERLGGMFALALYDRERGEILLARDRLGKKPLYWYCEGGVLVFGSELKALRAHPNVPHHIDPRSLAHYLAREYVPTPRTIYADVHKLMPGSLVRVRGGAVTSETFWRPCRPQAAPLSEAEALERFDALLSKAVKERLVADVPLGIFLSGGLDSSAVAYYAAQAAGEKVKTFSIGFSDTSFDESAHARAVAAHLGTDHHEHLFSGGNALALIPDLAEVFDEPMADASALPTLLLSRFTREKVTVALGGDGVDELLLGYQTFRAEELAKLYQRLPQPLHNAARSFAAALPTSYHYFSFDFKARKFVDDFSADSPKRHLQWLGGFRREERLKLLAPGMREAASGVGEELIAQWQSECPGLEGLNALSHLYLRTYLMDDILVKVDRASMRYALEVRTPFLNHEVAEFLLALPPELKYRERRGKYLLRKLMEGHLPEGIVARKKHGFGIPLGSWLRRELKELCTDLLSESSLARSGFFDHQEVARLLQEHMSGARDHRKKLWTLMMFQLWYDKWIHV